MGLWWTEISRIYFGPYRPQVKEHKSCILPLVLPCEHQSSLPLRSHACRLCKEKKKGTHYVICTKPSCCYAPALRTSKENHRKKVQQTTVPEHHLLRKGSIAIQNTEKRWSRCTTLAALSQKRKRKCHLISLLGKNECRFRSLRPVPRARTQSLAHKRSKNWTNKKSGIIWNWAIEGPN